MGEDLLFTETEWTDALPGVVESMTEFLRPYRTAVYRDYGTHGEGWGSGSYVRIEGKIFIVTNHHVAAAREQQQELANPLGLVAPASLSTAARNRKVLLAR